MNIGTFIVQFIPLGKAISFLLCIGINIALGDIIHLKTGGRVEGKITNRTETQIIVDVGFGEMEVDTSEIGRIEWTDSDVRAEIEKGWKSITGPKEQVGLDTISNTNSKNEPTVINKPKNDQPENHLRKDTTTAEQMEKASVKTDRKIKQGSKPSISFQTSFAKPGTFAIGIANRNREILKKSGIEPGKSGNIPASVEIGIYYPTKFSLHKRWPLFIAMGPGIETGIAEINAYVKYADKLGFIVAAPELPAELDNEESRFYYTFHIIEYLKDEGHISGKPILIGGFNGGAQWALQIGAYGGDLFDGIVAIGCNNDGATIGYDKMKNETALQVPIYLLNGTKDKEAGTKSESYLTLVESIKKTGFAHVKEVPYKGGHSIPQKETSETLKLIINGSR